MALKDIFNGESGAIDKVVAAIDRNTTELSRVAHDVEFLIWAQWQVMLRDDVLTSEQLQELEAEAAEGNRTPRQNELIAAVHQLEQAGLDSRIPDEFYKKLGIQRGSGMELREVDEEAFELDQRGLIKQDGSSASGPSDVPEPPEPSEPGQPDEPDEPDNSFRKPDL